MRAFRECVFDDTIMGTTTVYTSTKFNAMLASAPDMVLQTVAANVVSPGAPGKLSVQLQVSSDGRNWLDKYDTAEIDDADQYESAVTTTVGYDDGTEPSMPMARLKITTSGSTTKMYLKLWVAGRAVVPGSVRQAAAARQRAAARAAQEQATQAEPAGGPKAGGCGGSCGCGGKCGGTGGVDKSSEAPSEARIRASVGARANRGALELGRQTAANRGRLSGVTAQPFLSGNCEDFSYKGGDWCDNYYPIDSADRYRCNCCVAWIYAKCNGNDDPLCSQDDCAGIPFFAPTGLYGALDPETILTAGGIKGGKKKDDCAKVTPGSVKQDFDICLGFARLQHGLRCEQCPSPLNPKQRAACVSSAADRFKDEYVDCFETAKCKCVHKSNCGWFEPGDEIPVPECTHPLDDLVPPS